MNAPAPHRDPRMPWENDIWTPTALFAGRTVFCLASGPSMNREIAAKVPGERTIVVNGTCRLKPDARVLYFTDNGWYAANREIVAGWSGLVVSMSRQAKRELDDPALQRPAPRILRIKGYGAPPFPPLWQHRPGFPPVGHPEVQQGRNSGNTAVALAIAMGAARVVLLGYDCRVVAGREHHHNEYSGPRDLSLYDNEFRIAFDGWNAAAIASGVEILNCTPGSAITEFPSADLDEVLACAPA